MIRSVIVCLVCFLVTADARADPDIVSGNYWIDRCKRQDVPCLAYVMAMQDMNDIQPSFGNKYLWCVPNGVTLAQELRVITAEMDRYPNMMQHPFFAIASHALVVAFPCSKASGR